ncbi:MAG: C1 family peptidase [Blautia sp.]|nr:C1 family peptidase [Blautia sp.]
MHSIQASQLEAFTKSYESDCLRRLASHALSKSALGDIAFVPEKASRLRHKFSLCIPTMAVANQKHSGRCWLFAATNILRESIAKTHNIEKFELSQSYLAFYDKFERCNFFLESILDTASLPTDDRTVMFILSTGVHDGGQWDMFANIVRKYGIVPKDVYDETYQSENTKEMNYVLNRNLKACAVSLRKMKQAGAGEEEIQKVKEEMLKKIYAFLVSCYGVPPKTFSFEYVDKDKAYHCIEDLTPLSFSEYCHVPEFLSETISIIHAPTKDKPFDKTYTIQYLGNVADGKEVRHLNLSLEDFKGAILAQLQAGEVVWFGSDVGHDGDRTMGLWDDQSFDYSLLSGLSLDISKEDALDYGFAAMNHAMVLTGVQLEEGKPVRWRIENSWGDEKGEKGYYICSDTWFDKYVFQAAVKKTYLGEKAALYDTPVTPLSPWDPMGTLAD